LTGAARAFPIPTLDLALAARSISFNLGAQWIAPFFAAYGLTEIDHARIAFFQLLDEFF
jgi:aminoglycoside phosphotransferase